MTDSKKTMQASRGHSIPTAQVAPESGKGPVEPTIDQLTVNQTAPDSQGLTARPTGRLNGGLDSSVADVRLKRLANVPRKFRPLYRRAWSGRSRKAGIRAFCLECTVWSATEVSKCSAPSCPLFTYRLKG